jgi:hypothetical protein
MKSRLTPRTLVAISALPLHAQIYTYTIAPEGGGGSLSWNASLAGALVKALPREPLEVPLEAMRDIVRRNDYDPARLPHVAPRQPGIAVQIFEFDHTLAWVLIDGTHRCARALQEHRAFWVYPLLAWESRLCFLGGRVDLLP